MITRVFILAEKERFEFYTFPYYIRETFSLTTF